MKSVLTITALTLLFSLHTFSQDKIQIGIFPDKPTSERLWKIIKPNVVDLQGLNDIESILMKSNNGDWQSALRNSQKDFYEEEGFNADNAKTIINKTLLSNGFLLIESISEYWDGSTWLIYSKTSYTYDVNNNKTESLSQTWDGSAYVNKYKYSYTYDANNNQTESLSQDWDGSTWVNRLKVSRTYDGNNNEIERLGQPWNGSAWANFLKYSYTYDSNNNQTEWLSQTWDGSAYVNTMKYSYAYDENNNQTEWLRQDWDGSAWLDVVKSSATYDVNNNLILSLSQIWDGSNWVNYVKYFYTYDENNNLTVSFGQIWDGSTWVNSGDKYSYTYDGNNNQIEFLWQMWDGFIWKNLEKHLFTYDVNNDKTEQLRQTWDGSAWKNSDKHLFTYAPATISTTITTDISAGSQTIEVTSTEGFSIGDNIVINRGGANEESNIITGFGSLILQSPLQFNHLAGERIINTTATSVEEKYSNILNNFSLSQNFPNPFNPSTKIRYSITQSGLVTLKVYDVLGTEIETLVNEEKPVGNYELNWKATNLPSGVYFYRLQAGSFVQTRKMILLK